MKKKFLMAIAIFLIAFSFSNIAFAAETAVGYGTTMGEANRNAHDIAGNACPLGGYTIVSVTTKQQSNNNFMCILRYRCANQN